MPGTNVKQVVRLTPDQRDELTALTRLQTVAAAQARRARILLLADADHPEGQRPDHYIARVVGVCERSVARVRHQFLARGLEATERRPLPPSAHPLRLDGAAEAQLVVLACSTPPTGRSEWTLQLLVEELARLRVVTSVCRETVRRCLKKTGSSRGGPSGSASRKRTGPGSWPRWNKSSTPTTRATTPPTF